VTAVATPSRGVKCELYWALRKQIGISITCWVVEPLHVAVEIALAGSGGLAIDPTRLRVPDKQMKAEIILLELPPAKGRRRTGMVRRLRNTLHYGSDLAFAGRTVVEDQIRLRNHPHAAAL
jgi:hypothetical protein